MYIDLTAPKVSSKPKNIIKSKNAKNVFIETYGCQMNYADSEIVAAILSDRGYQMTDKADNADVILLNTCSIRDNAEQKIFHRLSHLRAYKKKRSKLVVGILGCMAERLKASLLGERDLVSIVVGPDEYRALPELVDRAFYGEHGLAVTLSKVETYDDITPLRTEGISAWMSIMRGCNNFCAFCVVPYTRGRERSRNYKNILEETASLYANGIKEITLLGQNVNSYNDKENAVDFPALLSQMAVEVPNMRIRYTTSHPHDLSDRLIEAHAKFDNICNYIHLPVQSGSSTVLKRMRRDYNADEYLKLVEKIRREVLNVALSTDIIAGFCGETLEEHQATLDLMKAVRYEGAYMFKYSERENTLAYKKMEDDVPEEEKTRRLQEIIDMQHAISAEINLTEVGNVHEVLVEGPSKRNEENWQGRSDTNKVCVFPNTSNVNTGDLIKVKVERTTSATLFCSIV